MGTVLESNLDIVSPEKRSRMMRGIRARDTKPEMLVRRFLHSRGFRFRLAPKDLPGRPDIVLPRHRVALFVHGCFWHGHTGCRYATTPATRTEFWTAKIAANRLRDAAAEQKLHALGWRVGTIWECALRKRREAALQEAAAFIASDRGSVDIEELARA